MTEVGDSSLLPRGVRVTESGPAWVDKGEIILPAAGSEAQAERVLDDARTMIQYHFPVEIVVVAAAEAPDPETIVQMALLRLAQQLENS